MVLPSYWKPLTDRQLVPVRGTQWWQKPSTSSNVICRCISVRPTLCWLSYREKARKQGLCVVGKKNERADSSLRFTRYPIAAANANMISAPIALLGRRWLSILMSEVAWHWFSLLELQAFAMELYRPSHVGHIQTGHFWRAVLTLNRRCLVL